MKKWLVAVTGGALLFCGSAWAGNEAAANVVQAKHPQVKAIPAGKHATQVFMDLVNTGDQVHTIIAALSPISKETQLHKTVKIRGKSHMRQVPRIKIKSHRDRHLQEGGFHVMLLGLSENLKAGQKVPLTLVFADGSDLDVEAIVSATPRSRLG